MSQGSSLEKWFALLVKPRHEKAVSGILKNKGYETFLPLFRRRHIYSQRRFKDVDLPLFPGYVFCRFDPSMRLPLLTTPGVFCVVGAGRTPMPVDDQEMTSLLTVARTRLSAQPCPFLEVGQKVRVSAGPLAGVEGVLVDINESLRLILSIALLQRSVLVEVDRNWVTTFNPIPSIPTALSALPLPVPRAA